MNQAYLYVLIPIVIAIILNLIIFGLKWPSNSTNNRFLPPGWLIGVIWVIVLGFLGYALYLTTKARDNVSSVFIVILMLICLAYPFYTRGLTTGTAAKVGDVATLVIGFAVTVVVALRTPQAVPYLIPLLVWASYV